jgi:hypothetical protein
MYALYFHSGFLVVLLVSILSFFIMIRTDKTMTNFDVTRLYSYSKFNVDTALLSSSLQLNNSFAWLDSDNIDEACSDLRYYDFPQVKYAGGNMTTVPGNPGCVLQYTWVDGVGGASQAIGISGVVVPYPFLCKAGTYDLKLSYYYLPGSTPPVVTPDGLAFSVTIASTGNASINKAASIPLGTGFSIHSNKWTECVQKRKVVVDHIHKSMDCITENSQMCSCVYMFTKPMLNSTFVMPQKLQRSLKMSAHLYEGLEKCVKLRRSRDKYEVLKISTHKQSQMLLVICMAMLWNMMYHVYNYNYQPQESFGFKNAVMVVSVLGFIGVSIAAGAGGDTLEDFAWLEIMCIGLALLVVGVYYEIFYLQAEARYSSLFKPTVHPYFFGIVYFCLSSYVLVQRDVIQVEILGVEGLKSMAMAWLYTKIVIFYTKSETSSARQILVHRAQLGAILLISVVSLDNLFSPLVAVDGEFDVMALLPFAWVMLSIGENVFMKEFSVGYEDVKGRDEEFVDIRRNIIFTLMHVLLVWICSHFFSVYMHFADSHKKLYKYPSPYDSRFLLRNKVILPGYVHEGL